MEDFGYKKTNESTKNTFLAKKIFLVSATLLSLSAFFYITINAYYFINENSNNKDIETIKSPELPIKVYENDYEKEEDKIINRSIYDDIFGNRKEIIRENIKINKNSEPALPPRQTTIPSEKDSVINQENLDDSATKTEEDSLPNLEAEKVKNTKNNITNPPAITKEAPIAKPQNTVARKKNSIRVQISAMASQEGCEEYFKKLRRLYPEVFSGTKYYIEEADLGRRGIFYRLQIGDFFNQIDAEDFCNNFISQTQKSRSECIIVE